MDGSDSAYEKHIRDRDGVVSLTYKEGWCRQQQRANGVQPTSAPVFSRLFYVCFKIGGGTISPGPLHSVLPDWPRFSDQSGFQRCQIGQEICPDLATRSSGPCAPEYSALGSRLL